MGIDFQYAIYLSLPFFLQESNKRLSCLHWIHWDNNKYPSISTTHKQSVTAKTI